jgi:hypothetical protein
MSASIRKNFEFDPRYVEIITRLRDVCALKTDTSVVEEALVLLAWASAEAAKGHKIGAYDEQTQVLREITTTALEMASRWVESGEKQVAAPA